MFFKNIFRIMDHVHTFSFINYLAQSCIDNAQTPSNACFFTLFNYNSLTLIALHSSNQENFVIIVVFVIFFIQKNREEFVKIFILYLLNVSKSSELKTFVRSIVKLERLISISIVGTFEFRDKFFILQLKLSLGFGHHRISKKK